MVECIIIIFIIIIIIIIVLVFTVDVCYSLTFVLVRQEGYRVIYLTFKETWAILILRNFFSPFYFITARTVGRYAAAG